MTALWKRENDRDTTQSVRVCNNNRCPNLAIPILTQYHYCIECRNKYGLATPGTNPIFMEEVLWDSASRSILPRDPKKIKIKRRHACAYEGGGWKCWCGWATTEQYSSGLVRKHEEQIPEWVFKNLVGDQTNSGKAVEISKPDAPKGVIVLGAPVQTTPQQPIRNFDFTCGEFDKQGEADVQGCPIYRGRPNLLLPAQAWYEWIDATRAFDTEWLAYLIGKWVEPNDEHPSGAWEVTDYYFPRQECTGSHVDVAEEDIRNLKPGVIGDVHSHVGMSAFFSTEDTKHFNHNVHIVCNRDAKIQTSLRATLKCGSTTRVQAEVIKLVGDAPNHPAIAALRKVLTKKEYKTSSGGGSSVN